MGQTDTVGTEEFPYWMRLGDDPWETDLNAEYDYILVDKRTVWVERSLAQQINIVDLEFWPKWVDAIGLLAVPLVFFGWARRCRISLRIDEVNYANACPTFQVRIGGLVILRATNFDLVRQVIRCEIAKR